jgi:hypothetical protein
MRKLIYKICSHHDIAEILLMFVLNSSQSINNDNSLFYIYICNQCLSQLKIMSLVFPHGQDVLDATLYDQVYQ